MLHTDIIEYSKAVGSPCINEHKNQNVIRLLLHTEMKKEEWMTRAFKDETSSNTTHRMTSKVDVNSDKNNLQ